MQGHSRKMLGAIAASLLLSPALLQAQTAPSGASPDAGKGGAGAAASSQTSKAGGASSNGQLSSGDKKFVKEAAEDGLVEVTLGRLASEKGSNQAVKAFGAQMVKDHGAANQELEQLATGKGLTVPKTIEKKDQKLEGELSKATGAEFDRKYMRAMVEDHKKDIAKFEHQAKNGSDPDLKAFAEKTLPTLKEHFRMAQDALSQVAGKPSSASTATSASKGGAKSGQ